MAIALFGQFNEVQLRTFLELPNGIPSRDTPGRVFARLVPVDRSSGYDRHLLLHLQFAPKAGLLMEAVHQCRNIENAQPGHGHRLSR